MSNARYFFATMSDLLPGLRRLEQARSVRYVQTGLLDSGTPTTFSLGESLPELGQAPSGDAGRVPAFLVLDYDEPLVPREVPQHSGGLLFAIDELKNPNSTIFRAGGLYSDSVLISGEIATTGTTSTAIDLHRLMVRMVTKGFRRVQSFWLGPEALEMLKAGGRLTKSVQMLRVYDLQFENPE